MLDPHGTFVSISVLYLTDPAEHAEFISSLICPNSHPHGFYSNSPILKDALPSPRIIIFLRSGCLKLMCTFNVSAFSSQKAVANLTVYLPISSILPFVNIIPPLQM